MNVVYTIPPLPIGLAHENVRKKLFCHVRRHNGRLACQEYCNSYGNVHTFKYLSSLLTNQNSIHEQIKCRLKAGNSYYSDQTHLSSRLLFKNLKIKIYKTIVLPAALYSCETWSLTLREKCRLRVFENRILRGIFGPKRGENEECRKVHNDEFRSWCLI